MNAHRPCISRYRKGCRCVECAEVARERRAAARQAERVRAGANGRCPVCDWVGFDLMRHERVAHPLAGPS